MGSSLKTTVHLITVFRTYSFILTYLLTYVLLPLFVVDTCSASTPTVPWPGAQLNTDQLCLHILWLNFVNDCLLQHCESPSPVVSGSYNCWLQYCVSPSPVVFGNCNC
jgi:hypothetical protein